MITLTCEVSSYSPSNSLDFLQCWNSLSAVDFLSVPIVACTMHSIAIFTDRAHHGFSFSNGPSLFNTVWIRTGVQHSQSPLFEVSNSLLLPGHFCFGDYSVRGFFGLCERLDGKTTLVLIYGQYRIAK
jgi:hypothetical protein